MTTKFADPKRPPPVVREPSKFAPPEEQPYRAVVAKRMGKRDENWKQIIAGYGERLTRQTGDTPCR